MIPRPILLYALKCVLAGALAFLVARLLQAQDFAWFFISVMLVLSPDGADALPLALTRTKANAVGALASLPFLALGLSGAPALLPAIGLTVLLCHVAGVMGGSRSALAAVIILLLREPGAHPWASAFERLGAVAAGCMVGLLVTVIFHRALKNAPRLTDPGD